MNKDYQKLISQLQDAIDIIDAVVGKVANKGDLLEDCAGEFYDYTESAVISLQDAMEILEKDETL